MQDFIRNYLKAEKDIKNSNQKKQQENQKITRIYFSIYLASSGSNAGPDDFKFQINFLSCNKQQ